MDTNILGHVDQLDEIIALMLENQVLAESNETRVVEGNHYFPAESVDSAYLADSSTHTRCPWKGKASYYDVVVDGQANPDAAWYYPDPSKAADQIKDYVAFWRGVKVES